VLALLAAEVVTESSWTWREIAGLVFVGILVLVLWLAFRRMQFPDDWERKD
jgi:hypothetical protein